MKRPDAGATANILLMVGKRIYLANVGDSRTCINENGTAVPLSIDHKPSNTSSCSAFNNHILFH